MLQSLLTGNVKLVMGSIMSAVMAGCLNLGTVGCAALNTGPKVAETVSQAAFNSGTVLLSQMSPTEMTAGANGEINDPRYRVQVFAGAGTYVDFQMSLAGANIGFDIDAAGTGMPIDRELANKLLDIQNNTTLSEQARKDAMIAAITSWLQKSPPPPASTK